MLTEVEVQRSKRETCMDPKMETFFSSCSIKIFCNSKSHFSDIVRFALITWKGTIDASSHFENTCMLKSDVTVASKIQVSNMCGERENGKECNLKRVPRLGGSLPRFSQAALWVSKHRIKDKKRRKESKNWTLAVKMSTC